MKRVSVGVHVHAQPVNLYATLAALRAHTGSTIDVILLPDGPDGATRAALDRMTYLPQLSTASALGGAACFNRLVSSRDADVYVLLESGAFPGPRWLDHLLAALDAHPQNGLAGPSTNRTWNEQGVVTQTDGSLQAVALTARWVAERYAGATKTLEPLHSLADFCYAVRREVVEAIGAADEGYGLGPCWEMDYNIRAARAGFRGVWACPAYVYRSPFTPRREREEAARFEASKHRYQNKFCALHLRGERSDYESHCRGDQCEHFAPRGAIQLHLSMPAPIDPALSTWPAAHTRLPDLPAVPTGAPLISCIMPTRGRPEFIRQAIAYFQRQDYPERELIIVHELPADLPYPLPADPRIRVAAAPAHSSIGAKRNVAIGMSRGAIVAQWDDDDWYAAGRLSAQANPVLKGEADITGLEAGVFFDLDNWAFWRCTPDLHRRLFVGDVHGGTLVFDRKVWDRFGRYPDASLAEDAAFLTQARRGGARLRRLANDDLFVYLRHGANAWSFPLGRYLDPDGWRRVAEPGCLKSDLAFYRNRGGNAASPGRLPLVTCIMPTYNRRRFAAQAVEYFTRQDYASAELLILDDGDQPVADLARLDPRVRYERIPGRMILGAKRNRACEMAAGEIILHWDDDDWMAPSRISYQVGALLDGRADLCGAPRQIYYDPAGDRAWLYDYAAGGRAYVPGNTLCYRKSFWRVNRFPEIQVGEDTRFLWSSRANNLAVTAAWDFYVALLHTNNTSPKGLKPPYWQPHPVAQVHELLGGDLDFYRSMGRPDLGNESAQPAGVP